MKAVQNSGIEFCLSVGYNLRNSQKEQTMEINYQETSNDLLARIRIHEMYGARNIDQWNTEVLKPTANMKILDVGCGAGKQCFLYSDDTDRKADITGTDFSEELLA